MSAEVSIVINGVSRASGFAEGEALVTTEMLSHGFNAINSQGVITMQGHELEGRCYAGKVIVYDTDRFSTIGAWGLYFKSKIVGTGPIALLCRTVHPISIGGAVDSRIPAVDGLDVDPCTEIKTGDWVRIEAPRPGGRAIVRVYPSREAAEADASVKDTIEALKGTEDRSWDRDEFSLTPEEEGMLNGEQGEARRLAMERLVEFGQGAGAKRMVKICYSHVFSDWKSDDRTAGAWPFYEEFARMGARFTVPTTVETTGIADELAEDEEMPWNYRTRASAREMLEGIKGVHENLEAMGAYVVPTCIPYMSMTIPKLGEHFTSCESNYDAYANIMLGARANRDPANMVFYSALTGVMPEYGMHLDENRRGQIIFDVEESLAGELREVGDYVALGGAIGFHAVDRVPVVTGMGKMTNAQAKAFCACVSPALTYPMIHIVGVTPEARTLEDAFGGEVPKDVERVKVGKREMAAVFDGIHQTDRRDIDVAIVGCPLLILDELAQLADMLEGRKLKTRLWLFTDFVQYSAAMKAGIIERIESSGAKVIHSTCPGAADRAPEEAEKIVVATDSLKVAMLFAGIGWPKNWLGTREDVINAAISGRFERTRWLS